MFFICYNYASRCSKTIRARCSRFEKISARHNTSFYNGVWQEARNYQKVGLHFDEPIMKVNYILSLKSTSSELPKFGSSIN